MRKMLWREAAILCLSLFLAGCAGAPFAPHELAPTSPDMTAARLAESVWTGQAGVFRLRQAVLFEFNGRAVPMSGMMRLDFNERRLRLVAMNDMGVKLFDLEVAEKNETLHYLLPELAGTPRFSEAVAASVRRIFLDSRPSGSDLLSFGRDRYLLTRPWQGGEIRFVLGGGAARLLETTVATEQVNWKAAYYEYQTDGKVVYPRGIVLDDRVAPYRLTLWLEEVRRIDE